MSQKSAKKTCVACAEEIQPMALLCRHCGVLQDDPRFASLPTKSHEQDTEISELETPQSTSRRFRVDIDQPNHSLSMKIGTEGTIDFKRIGLMSAIAISVALIVFGMTNQQTRNSNYAENQQGLFNAASDCASQVISANKESITSTDPSIADYLIGRVASCIAGKNVSYRCSSTPDPVCVWNKDMAEGPRVMYMDVVYNKFKAAGNPFFQN